MDYHHKYLLYTDSSGNQHTISGWTGNAQPGLPYGNIQVETNLPFNASNPDHPNNPNATGQRQHREPIAQGADLSATWQRMVSNAGALDNRFPYDPLQQNSNTLADSVLRSVGLPQPTQDGISGHWAPASGRTLNATSTPQVPGLSNSGRAISAADIPAAPGQDQARNTGPAPFNDERGNALYADFRARFPNLPEERVAQFAAEGLKRGYEPGDHSEIIPLSGDRMGFRDQRQPGSHFVVDMNTPSPPLTETMQGVDAHLRQLAQTESVRDNRAQIQGPSLG